MTYARRQQIDFLANRPLTPLSQLAVTVAVTLVKWNERRCSRIALKHLDDHLLKDIGLNRDDALHEARRVFWRD
ncbi:DUF1127 domain-containing protein [Parasulfitobacter algicola]|uniref:DUF1127 domain-containing protein n=1 Tax=Parasulfitobacter algicola TaxID=2614809 RepID=A0ABX2IRP7_9RHOB|nr:DUF1127 domain-containing protein [Sulfitobacter algicola]NSX55587.1 DUF1127 domain-containing protein [Sulfitobacter algicola]